MRSSSRTRSSKTSPTHSRSDHTAAAVVALLTLSAAVPLFAQQAQQAYLKAVPTRDQKVIRRWELPGDPHGLAIGADGTLYVGLAQPQAVEAIDPSTGLIKRRLVLDSAQIAATKELVTLRINPAGTRLYIANGSDESATILALPSMTILREITIEGEEIHDALPDPTGRYLFVLGRRVHVYDAEGQTELHTIDFQDPMAIAVNPSGSMLAVVGPQSFGSVKATVVALYDTPKFNEIARDPLQTEKTIEAAFFAAGDRALIALSRDTIFEKPLNHRVTMMSAEGGGRMRMSIDFGDLVSSERICLPDKMGPEIAALASPRLLLFAEKRCSAGSAFIGSDRLVAPASLYGVDAYAIVYDSSKNVLYATDPSGYLTIYRVPRVANVP